MENTVYIHPSAIVSPEAEIGEGSKIWHFCHVMGQSKLGQGCVLGQNVFVASGVFLGNGCKVQNNVSVYKGVVCEDDVFLGPSMVFTNVLNPRAFIQRKNEFKPTLVRKGASIGANATIVCGNSIGQYALIGAGAVVTQNVPDFALMLGVPAKIVGYVSRSAQNLDFDKDGKASCPETGEWYQKKGSEVIFLNEKP